MTALRIIATCVLVASMGWLVACGSSSSDAATQGRTPSDAFREMQEHVRLREWEALYDCYHPKSQGVMDMLVNLSVSIKAQNNSFDGRMRLDDGLEPKERFARFHSDPKMVAASEETFAGEVVGESIEGDHATVLVKQYGETVEIYFTNDHGRWKHSQGANSDQPRRDSKREVDQRITTLLALGRGSIFNYRQREGHDPDLVKNGWAMFYRDPSRFGNPLSPESVATTFAVVSESGVAGRDFDPKTVGWVWNSADKELYAAGFDELEQPTAETVMRPSERERIGGRQLDKARTALEGFRLGPTYSPVELVPELGTKQWAQLIEAGHLKVPLKNPYSPADVAARIIEVREPGAKGLAVDPASAGWVWNSADRKIYLAGQGE